VLERRVVWRNGTVITTLIGLAASPVTLYGLASRLSRDVDEWCETREEAEAILALVLADEPELADVLYVAEVELVTSEN
jgi:hypothetical protein